MALAAVLRKWWLFVGLASVCVIVLTLLTVSWMKSKNPTDVMMFAITFSSLGISARGIYLRQHQTRHGRTDLM